MNNSLLPRPRSDDTDHTVEHRTGARTDCRPASCTGLYCSAPCTALPPNTWGTFFWGGGGNSSLFWPLESFTSREPSVTNLPAESTRVQFSSTRTIINTNGKYPVRWAGAGRQAGNHETVEYRVRTLRYGETARLATYCTQNSSRSPHSPLRSRDRHPPRVPPRRRASAGS